MASTDQTGRIGIHAVSAILTEMGWAVREQATSDFGVDLQAEKLGPSGDGTGRLIAVQVKSGKSWFKKRGPNYVYYGSDRHREYWLSHSLPVFIVLHDPETKLTVWQKIEPHLIVEGSKGAWSIDIPPSQTLDTASDRFLMQGAARDLGSIRRVRLALDLEHIRALVDVPVIYMKIDDWVNKTLNFRGAEFVFNDDPDAPTDMAIGYMMPGYSIAYFMAVGFPWLNWELHEYLDESEGAYEVAQWILSVEVNDVGRSALRLEEFYSSDLPPFRPEPDGTQNFDDWDDCSEPEPDPNEEEGNNGL